MISCSRFCEGAWRSLTPPMGQCGFQRGENGGVEPNLALHGIRG